MPVTGLELRVNFPEQQLAPGLSLKEIQLHLQATQFMALVGRNGAGKSTLLKAMTGLLPIRGEIFFSAPHAFLPQHMPVPWALRARDIVAMAWSNPNDWQSAEAANAAEDVLHSWGLSNLALKEFHVLSGGERQLVWLAQIEFQQSPIVLLDEPTQHLDVFYRKKVFDWMDAQVQSGKIVVCVTHEIEYLKKMKGTVLNLSDPNPQLQALEPAMVNQIITQLES
ncbi:MAG: ABC transporter ATP-binding protein [Cytophagaceae bacterium]|jgi:iron complex transport system ATP-binding protein|nr:ABC transporter ATP-binding protein [Cytophagaceae bacterium]